VQERSEESLYGIPTIPLQIVQVGSIYAYSVEGTSILIAPP